MAILKKITIGFVIQSFDTEKEEFTDQEFVAGDECIWKDDIGDTAGEPVQGKNGVYLSYDMVQPKDNYKEKIEDILYLLDDESAMATLGMIRDVIETNC